MKRALVAKAGIYANNPDEATYPFTRVDARRSDARRQQAQLRADIPAGQLPPVNSFWSITMYDGKTQLLINNPLDRYLINSPMMPGLKTNADGSLPIYIQSKSPGADKEANWLPAPDGPIYMVMRLYWPKTAPPSILPAGAAAPGSRRASARLTGPLEATRGDRRPRVGCEFSFYVFYFRFLAAVFLALRRFTLRFLASAKKAPTFFEE